MISNPIIREAGEKDISKLAQLHVQTFIETHGGPHPPSLELRQSQWSEMFRHKDNSWFCLVVESAAGEVLGFAKGQPYDHPDFPDYHGELNKIYVLRAYQGQGLGKRLLYSVADQFMQRKIYSMLLFGDAANRSNGFYERMGAERLLSTKGEFHGGYGWRDVRLIIQESINKK